MYSNQADPERAHAERVAREQLRAQRERILTEAAAEAGAAPLSSPADNPQSARDYLASAFALAATDADAAAVVSRALPVLLMDLVAERAQTDDTFAMRAAQILVQSSTLPTTPSTPRGRQGVARRS